MHVLLLGEWGDRRTSVLCGGYILIQLSTTFERCGKCHTMKPHLRAYRVQSSASTSSHDVSFQAFRGLNILKNQLCMYKDYDQAICFV